jgi:Zn-dependent metalloprotease
MSERGTAYQRRVALATSDVDHTFRLVRALRAAYHHAAGQLSPITLAIKGLKRRAIFAANNTETLPGELIRPEGAPPTGDPAVDEVYDGLGATFDFFWEVYRRNPIHENGMPLTATVHFGRDYQNALFDGERLVLGDGDGEVFNRFTISLEGIGHEFTHGVVACESRLLYFSQSGALIESISDVFGSLVKQRLFHQTAEQADWLIGSGLFTAGVNGVALRSIMAPGTAYDDPMLGKDPQPVHMSDFVQTLKD